MCPRLNIHLELHSLIYPYKAVGKKTTSIKIMGVAMRVDRRTCVDLSECPILPSVITHGFVNGSGSLEGARYEFSCESGYSLIGDSQMVCTDAGVWNGSLPTCLIDKKNTKFTFTKILQILFQLQLINKDITTWVDQTRKLYESPTTHY